MKVKKTPRGRPIIKFTAYITDQEPLGTRLPMVEAMARRTAADRRRNDAWIDTAAGVKAKRRQMLSLLGYRPPAVPFAPKLLREERFRDFTRKLYRIRINADDFTEAVLYMPTSASRRKPAPALLAQHESGGQFLLGWEKMCDLPHLGKVFRASRLRCYGGQVPNDFYASQGYAVLSFDQVGFGSRAMWRDRKEYENRHNLTAKQELETRLRMRYEQSTLHRAMLVHGCTEAEMSLYDSMRAIDFLQGIPSVDGSRIGVFGLSVGAMHAHHVAGADPRVKASVRVCWSGDMTEMLLKDGPRVLGNHFLFPRLNADLHVPEWVALSHPNAALLINGTKDVMYSLENQKRTRRAVLDVARRQNRTDRVRWHFFDGPHQFHPAEQRVALDFFREFL